MSSEQERSGRNIICLGASAGGVEALRALLVDLPRRFPATLFAVQHMAPNGEGLLKEVLGRSGLLPIVVPSEREPIQPGTVYIPRPERHLVISDHEVHLSRGPKQNRHRPSVDVLFRSAALAYGPRVIGIVLTGMLDDGTAGLLAIKRRGGIAIVQDPTDAVYPGMPTSALRSVKVDYCVRLSEMPKLLLRLVAESVGSSSPSSDRLLELERRADEGEPVDMEDINSKPSPFVCPECHGVLWQINDAELPRFRCRVGHGYSIESLLFDQDSAVEDALWAAVRNLEESARLSRRMAEQWRTRGSESLARELQDKSMRGDAHAAKIRELLMAVNGQR